MSGNIKRKVAGRYMSVAPSVRAKYWNISELAAAKPYQINAKLLASVTHRGMI